MYALGWHDLKLKTIITNRGTTLSGTDSIRYRHKIVVVDGVEVTQKEEKRIKRPRMIEDFFECFSAVDVQDHLRQGSLRMEEVWKTKQWFHRIFAKIYGIILTDCFLAYRWTKTSQHDTKIDDFSTFLGKLCKQMIDNEGNNNQRITRSDEVVDTLVTLHHQAQLIDHPYYSDRKGTDVKARVYCKVDGCTYKTGTYCVCCSIIKQVDGPNDSLKVMGVFGVCSTGTGRKCYAKHLEATK